MDYYDYYHLVSIFLVPRALYFFILSFLIPTRSLGDKYYINLMFKERKLRFREVR